MDSTNTYKSYRSLLLLLVPPLLFGFLLFLFKDNPKLDLGTHLFILPLQLWILLFSGTIATIGGIQDWRFHRYILKMKMSQKERDAEAQACAN